MKLNLGCGSDIRDGYVNVDLRPPCDRKVDLSQLPWPFEDQSAEEVLMLDFLEHFPYRKTSSILQEVWRVLKPGGILEVQVPDFEVCAFAAIRDSRMQCNKDGTTFGSSMEHKVEGKCSRCGQTILQIAQAAIERLYGGQDVEGNWHFTAFTKDLLEQQLGKAGFGDFEWPEFNQNGETFAQNWNIKVRARKKEDAWGDNE